MPESVTIAILPSDRADRRVRLTLAPNSLGIRLTDETFSSDVGWFAQAHIDLSPEQVHDLRSALGNNQRTKPIAFTASREAASRISEESPPTLTIHRAG